MTSYLDCWVSVATALFSQALAGEPQLTESLPKPLEPDAVGITATIEGDQEGRFAVVLDPTIFSVPLMGEGVDQKSGWAELLREVFESAVGELLAKSGQKCRVEKVVETGAESKISRAFQLKSGANAWTILVRDDVKVPKKAAAPSPVSAPRIAVKDAVEASPSNLSRGIELLLDVELEATLRFGCRELPLGEILDLGPGDVVELDRQVSDPSIWLWGTRSWRGERLCWSTAALGCASPRSPRLGNGSRASDVFSSLPGDS